MQWGRGSPDTTFLYVEYLTFGRHKVLGAAVLQSMNPCGADDQQFMGDGKAVLRTRSRQDLSILKLFPFQDDQVRAG